MRMVVLTLVAVGALAFVTTLPSASGSTSPSTSTVAEARLIHQLREMAQPPAMAQELPRRTRVEVAMTAPAAPQPAAAVEKLVVVPAELNVRAEPSREAAIKGRLAHGDTIEVAERANGWVRLTGGGLEGWANAEFLATAH